MLVLPDGDVPGQRYSSSVQASLQRAEIEYSVVDFGKYGNDFRDFLKDHTLEELLTFIGSPWVSGALSLCEEEEICI